MAIKQVVSIEITDATTKVAFKSYGKAQPVLYKTVCFENKANTVVDGYIMDKVAYGMGMKKALSAAGISCKNLVFVLTGNKIVSREVMVPVMKEKLMKDYIESNRAEYFPMDTTGFVFTYTVLEDFKDEGKMRIMIYAAPGDLIHNYEDFALEMGFNVIAIDYIGNAIYQWLKNHEGRNDIYLQLNERNSIITIMKDGKLALQRMMSFGAGNVVSKYLEKKGMVASAFQTGLEQLQEKEVLYPEFNAVNDAEDEATVALRTDVTNSVRPLFQQITQVLEYYSTKNRETEINRVFIGGCGVEIKNLVKLLKNEFQGVDFVLRLKPDAVRLGKKCTTPENRVSEYLGAFGASNSSINFSNIQLRKDFQRVVAVCSVAFALVVIASGIMVAGAIMDLRAVETENENYKNKVQTLQATEIEKLESDYVSTGKIYEQLQTLGDVTFTHNENWNAILAALEKELVKGTIVSSISSGNTGLVMNMEISADSINGETMVGEAEAKIKAAKIIQNLKAIPYFKSVIVNSVAIKTDVVEEGDVEYSKTTISFSAVCEYQKPVEEENK